MPEVRTNDSSTPGLPLSGRTVVVTRAADQAAGLAAPLRCSGADVIMMPVIRIAEPVDWTPTDDALDHLDSYDWVILTSTNGVDAFFGRLEARGLTLDNLKAARIAVVGSATAEHLSRFGLVPHVVPESYRAEAVVAALAGIGPKAGPRVLLARAEEAREVLPHDLRELGFEVDVVPVYRLEAAPVAPEVLERFFGGSVDVVTFASGGTARRFVESLESAGLDPLRALETATVASIGPVTTEGLTALGIRTDIEAPEATAESLADAIARHFSRAAQ